MTSRKTNLSTEEFTTTEEDKGLAEQLKDRLRQRILFNTGVETRSVEPVQMSEGRHKYVLIQADKDGMTKYFVSSRRGAAYHLNVAEPLIAELESAGYYDIDVTGGGRIDMDEERRTISIYGFSYSFGQANHAISREVVLDDPRYKDWEVTISNDGY